MRTVRSGRCRSSRRPISVNASDSDAAAKTIPGADREEAPRGRSSASQERLELFASEQPFPPDSCSRQLALAGEALHPLHVEMEELRRLLSVECVHESLPGLVLASKFLA